MRENGEIKYWVYCKIMKHLIKNKIKRRAGAQPRRYHSDKGFALAMTLVIFAILLLLSSSYIASVAYDAKFAQVRTLETQAIFLARSGIKYYIYRGQPDDGIQKTFVDGNAFFVEKIPINDKSFIVKSTGIVNNLAGAEIAKEEIFAPEGELPKWRRYR